MIDFTLDKPNQAATATPRDIFRIARGSDGASMIGKALQTMPPIWQTFAAKHPRKVGFWSIVDGKREPPARKSFGLVSEPDE